MTNSQILKRQFKREIEATRDNLAAIQAELEPKINARQKLEELDRRTSRYAAIATAIIFALTIMAVKFLLI
jgi:hypothetical protein